MGKPYASELDALPRTYEWARIAEIDGLATSVRQCATGPLIAVGSGGSFTAAHFASFLHLLYAGKLSRPMTPYELASSPVHLGDLGLLFLTAGGSNPDVLGCFDVAVQRVPKHLGLLCTRLGSPLANRVADVANAALHEFDLPTSKDGFLATNSLLATTVLLARAYQHDFPPYDSLPFRFADLIHPGLSGEDFRSGLAVRCRPLWDKPTTVVLYGPKTQAAAVDLESKFTESALGQVQIADYRNFAHGRHHWIAKHSDICAILSLASVEDISLAEKTLSLLPRNIPVVRFEVESEVAGSLKALVIALFIVGLAGQARGIDPGRPSVPIFGRKLYHLNGAYRNRTEPGIDTAEAVAIIRKAGLSITTLAARGRLNFWREAYTSFVDRLHAETFRAVVLDYDGTLCETPERSCGPRVEVTEWVVALLRAGILVGIATGRGKSVRKDLLKRIREPDLMSRVLLGYHNGAEIGFLDDDTQPPPPDDVDESLRAIAAVLIGDSRLGEVARIVAQNRQITLELIQPSAGQEVWEIVQRSLSRSGPPDVSVLQSSHSVDVLAPGVTKRSTVLRIKEKFGAVLSPLNVLCIGDRGRWPGNDFVLLQEPHSLSVDEVSSDPTTCWNLASAKSRCVSALLEYFQCMQFSGGALKIRL